MTQSLHSEVLDPLFDLLSIALELPEDYIRNLHKYEVKSEVSGELYPSLFQQLKGNSRTICVT